LELNTTSKVSALRLSCLRSRSMREPAVVFSNTRRFLRLRTRGMSSYSRHVILLVAWRRYLWHGVSTCGMALPCHTHVRWLRHLPPAPAPMVSIPNPEGKAFAACVARRSHATSNCVLSHRSTISSVCELQFPGV
jgi:hypothetical protein